MARHHLPADGVEQRLRTAAGDEIYQGAFLANAVHNLLFYDFPPWVFAAAYTVFGTLVLLTLWLVPVDWRKVRNPQASQSL